MSQFDRGRLDLVIAHCGRALAAASARAGAVIAVRAWAHQADPIDDRHRAGTACRDGASRVGAISR